MKLIVKLPDGCPIGAKRERRTVGEFQLLPHGKPPLHALEIKDAEVSLDPDTVLIVQAHYVPSNDSCGVIARFRSPSEDTYVAAMTAAYRVPPCMVFQLPTRQYVEIYLQYEDGDG